MLGAALLAALLALAAHCVFGATQVSQVLKTDGGPDVGVTMQQYCGPSVSTAAASAAWLRRMQDFRDGLVGKGFCNTTSGNIFADNAWASRQFVCPQVMLMDRYLYDAARHTWTVGRFLADLRQRYGGVDCVLLWQSFTNLGIDERNQMDELRFMPGGVAGLRRVVAEFHAANVTVLFPWNYWANTTGHSEPDLDFVRLLGELDADGFNTDAGGRGKVPGQRPYQPPPHQVVANGFDGTRFVNAGRAMGPVFHGHDLLDQPEHSAGCPATPILGGWAGEGGGPVDGACNAWPEFNSTPPVECAKWLEPRHTSQRVERKQTMRQRGLKWSWFNGVGYCSWENVFGHWSGISPRDGETMRRIFGVLRMFAASTSSCGWRPFFPVKAAAPAVASMFPGDEAVLWTVLRPGKRQDGSDDETGPLGDFTVTLSPATSQLGAPAGAMLKVPADWRWYDIWRAVKLTPQPLGAAALRAHGDSGVVLSGRSDDAYGTIAAVSPTMAGSAEFAQLLDMMRKLSATPIESYNAAPGNSSNNMFVRNAPQIPAPVSAEPIRAALNYSGMVKVPATDTFPFRYQGLDWNANGRLEPIYPVPVSTSTSDGTTEARPMAVNSFWLDAYPVTNAAFDGFLKEASYRPVDKINFLRHWNGTVMPASIARHPVVWVALSDARAFCKHVGKRLPDEWEWTYAAQGTDNRSYPWGSTRRESECMPPNFSGHGSAAGYLPDVDAFDKSGCASPFGAQLMVGTLWQWTNEFSDEHTRGALLKGGSLYFRTGVPAGEPSPNTPPGPPRDPWENRSIYYFPNCAMEHFTYPSSNTSTGPNVVPTECHGEVLLQDESYDRASTIGFRCAASAPEAVGSQVLKTDDGPVDIAVDITRPIFTVSPAFVSMTIDSASMCRSGWSFPSNVDPVMQARIRLLSEPGLVIRYGGTWSDNEQYNDSTAPLLPPLPGVMAGPLGKVGCDITAARWRELAAFAASVNASLVFGVDSLTRAGAAEEGPIDLDNADRLFKLAAGDAGSKRALLGWELGNEPINWREKGYTNLTARQHAADFSALRDHLSRVFNAWARPPLVLGPDVWGVAQRGGTAAAYLRQFLEAKPDVDIVTIHIYSLWIPSTNTSAADFYNETRLDVSKQGASTARRIVDAATAQRGGAQTPLWVGEGSPTWEVVCDHGCGALSRNLTFEIAYLDQMGSFAASGVSLFARQSLGSTIKPETNTSGGPAPGFWSAILWKKLMGEAVLNVSVAAGQGLRAYAHRAASGSSAFTLLMLNVNSKAADVRLQTPCAAALRYTLTAGPETQKGSSVLLNGKLLRFADPGSVVLPPIVGAPSSCTLLTLPPTSVTWLVVQEPNASKPSATYIAEY